MTSRLWNSASAKVERINTIKKERTIPFTLASREAATPVTLTKEDLAKVHRKIE